MAKTSLQQIVGYCDRLLKTTQVQDYDRARNGLQVENDGRVTCMASTVDASLATIQKAIAAKADLLLVHHGLFWGETCPWTGKRYELIQLLMKHNLAVYSSHLPLDVHPELGNNAQLWTTLGFRARRPFFFDHGQYLGYKARVKISRTELARRLEKATGTRCLVIPGGKETCGQVGVVTGGAGSELRKAAAEGVDTFITGEGPHWTYAMAEELGMNVFYGGHYATETFGVKALAARLSARFKLPWVFLNHPTGL